MIIDTHTHIGKIMNFDMKEEEVLYSMKKYGIFFSLVSNINGAENDHSGKPILQSQQKSQNSVFRETLDFAKKYPSKIGAVPWMKIRTEQPDREFMQLLKDNIDYVYAIKLHPFHSRISPDDERTENIYKLAYEFDLPVVSHTGGCYEAESIHLYNTAKKHPEINFVMIHMDLGTDNRIALELLGKLPNLYGDTTWVPISTTLEAIKRYGSEKMLFGSDNPIDGKDTYLHNKTGERSLYQQYFNEFKSIISKDDYENVMYKNAMRLFKIKSIDK